MPIKRAIIVQRLACVWKPETGLCPSPPPRLFDWMETLWWGHVDKITPECGAEVHEGTERPAHVLMMSQSVSIICVFIESRKRIYKCSFINRGLSQGPAAVSLWLSVADELRRNYWLILLVNWCMTMENNVWDVEKNILSIRAETLTHIFRAKNPSRLVVTSNFWSHIGFAEICCLLFNQENKTLTHFSLQSCCWRVERLCSKLRLLHKNKIYFVISSFSLALSVQLLTSCFHLHLRATLISSLGPLLKTVTLDGRFVFYEKYRKQYVVWKAHLQTCVTCI